LRNEGYKEAVVRGKDRLILQAERLDGCFEVSYTKEGDVLFVGEVGVEVGND
jgi:hypothetical protein